MAARRRRRVPQAAPPRREEFDGDDLAWFDASQTYLIDRSEHALALDLFALLPDEMEERLNTYSEENS